MATEQLSLTPLKNALASLENALGRVKDDLDRDGAVQGFEYTYELSWKTLKRYFSWNQQLEESNVKNLIREAGKQGLIDDVELWFAFHEARNLTSHMYSQKIAERVFAKAKIFLPEAKLLVSRLEHLLS